MMIKGEKIFSLFQSVSTLPDREDIKAQWSEFFSYLFLALLYREGSDPRTSKQLLDLADNSFNLGETVYHSEIGRAISKGLADRFYLLYHNSNTSDKERATLDALNKVFQPNAFFSRQLKAQDIAAISEGRELDGNFATVALYVGLMVGQTGFYEAKSLPRIFITLFGNIYLCKEDVLDLSVPELVYGQTAESGDCVTGLWSLISAMAPALSRFDYPGDVLGDVVSHYGFMTRTSVSEFVPLPRYASSLYLQDLLGLKSFNPVYVSALFYKQFLYNSVEATSLTRHRLMDVILAQIVKVKGDDQVDYLFSPDSYYAKLSIPSVSRSAAPVAKVSVSLKMALEALDTDVTDDLSDPAITPTDPVSEDVNSDPVDSPVDSEGFENSMDLVSFNKAGEGINEDLYRSAVVALNDRIQSDSTFPVSPEVRQALHQWVNGWIYRAAISATKDQIATLKLTQYLKNVSHINTK